MVRTALNMQQAYTEKYLSAVYQAFLTAMETQGKSDYAAFANDWVAKRDLTVNELNEAAISVLKFGSYLAFSSLVWRATQVFAGETLATWVAVLIAEWVARGLSLPVLEGIRTNVYNIGAPAGP